MFILCSYGSTHFAVDFLLLAVCFSASFLHLLQVKLLLSNVVVARLWLFACTNSLLAAAVLFFWFSIVYFLLFFLLFFLNTDFTAVTSAWRVGWIKVSSRGVNPSHVLLIRTRHNPAIAHRWCQLSSVEACRQTNTVKSSATLRDLHQHQWRKSLTSGEKVLNRLYFQHLRISPPASPPKKRMLH